MRKESFEQWNRRVPFEPYRVVCSDGTFYDIRHPEMAMPTRTEVVMGVAHAGTKSGASTFVSYFQVIRIEALALPPDAVPREG
jgi:transposase-like protein